MSESFTDFRKDHSEELRRVQEFLARPLSDDPVVLRGQIADGVSAFGRAGVITGWAVFYHKKARAEKLKPKSFGTILDREVQLEADTAEERRYREVWEGIVQGLKMYVSAGQSMISYAKEEMTTLSAGRG